jgi:membrane dipeptidase
MNRDIPARVAALLRRAVVWDNHACMPLRPGDDSFLPQLERMRTSGVTVVSLNISFDVVPPEMALLMLATFRQWVRDHEDRFLLADSVTDIRRAKLEQKLAVIFDIEGGNVVASHPGLVEIYYRLGVRWMLLAYNFNNQLGGGCMDEDCGLTRYGRAIIDEMQRVGMVLCCSHVGHRTAREAIEYSSNPVIFSHSNPAAVFSHVRNVPDDLLLACARRGGVININGVGLFLGDGMDGLGDDSTDTLVRHIDHTVQLVGPQHVGLGLDYIFDLSELWDFITKNPEKFPAVRPRTYRQVEPERIADVVERLIRMGYADTDVEGILGLNNLRLAELVWH